VLALALAKNGISSTIYELRPQTSQSAGGNIALAPNTARVLDHLGVYAGLRPQGFSYEELYFQNGAGQHLGTFLNGSQKEYSFSALRIHRVILHDELVRACGERGIEVHHGKKFVRVEETDKGVVVEFEDGEKVEGEYLVGCDGIHSKVRDHIRAVTPEFSGLMGIMGTVDEADLDAMHVAQKQKLPTPCMLFGATGSFAIMPSNFSGSEVGYFATIQEPADRGREGWNALGRDTAQLKSMLADRFTFEGAQYPPLVQELCRKTPTDTLTCWPFFSVPHLKHWTSDAGRVVIIGDAAHAIPPTGGQGAAMAFEDAETLAYTLRDILDVQAHHAHMSLEEVKAIRAEKLGIWQRHRLERIAKVLDFTTKNGNQRKATSHLYEQAAKEWLMWAAMKFAGPTGGAAWLYEYNSESVLKLLAGEPL
jgi:2-polyprenyl-6-methoxyphenol hydroxylase-like FAD-dependent oxidoreductase